jgi:hypothetical protein
VSGSLIIHAGPKRTASTLVQHYLRNVIDVTRRDCTAFNGNSHHLALTLSSFVNDGNSGELSAELSTIESGIIRSCFDELARLNAELNAGNTVVLSCELFAQIPPSAIDVAFECSMLKRKVVIYAVRKTDSLLRSLFANAIVGGYRGRAKDFIDDVRASRLHFADLFPPIIPWLHRGWQVKLLKYEKEGYIEDALLLITGSHHDINDLSMRFPPTVSEINRRLESEQLFIINHICRALTDHPSDLRNKADAFRFANRVVYPYFRDTPYTVFDYELESQPEWLEFSLEINEKRARHFERYCEFFEND